MNPSKTAVILVGYQNDYFAQDGILRGVIEPVSSVDAVLTHSIAFLHALAPTDVTLISTPIVLTPDYRALASPVGILNAIKESGAFKSGTTGADDIPELKALGERVAYVNGKVGFNAFSNTDLADVLSARGIENVLVAGMVTSLCIDSTGRAAYERGYNVTIVSDCTSARTETEQRFFCEHVFPLYGRSKTSVELLAELGIAAH
jgi:nicotinamidase-related amidase